MSADSHKQIVDALEQARVALEQAEMLSEFALDYAIARPSLVSVEAFRRAAKEIVSAKLVAQLVLSLEANRSRDPVTQLMDEMMTGCKERK